MNLAGTLLATVGVTTALLWLAGAIGARLRRALRLPVSPGLRLAADVPLGFGVIAVVEFVCAVLGLLSLTATLAVTVSLALLARWGLPRRLPVALTATAAAALPLLPVALAPPFFYDALVYHLALPWQALLEGRLHPHPEDLFSTFPPLAQLLALLPLRLRLDRVPALLHLAAVALAGTAVAAAARSCGARRWAANLAGATLVLLPAGMLVGGLPGADGYLLLAASAAIAAALRRRSPALAGLLAGVGLAARAQGLTWVVLIGFVVAALGPRLRSLLAYSGGVLATSFPWWGKNALLLGDPLAPIGWHREGVDTLWRDGGATLLSSGVGLDWLAAVPARLAPHLPTLLLLGLAAVAALLHRTRSRMVLAACSLLGTGAWLVTGTLPRFLLVPLAVLLILAASASRGHGGGWIAAPALSGVAALGLAFNITEVARLGGLELPVASAAELRCRFAPTDPVAAFTAAGALPTDARVLFIGEPRGYRFPRRFVAPSQHDVSPLRDLIEGKDDSEQVRSWLRARGFSHVLVNWGELRRLATSYPVEPWRTRLGRTRFEALLRSFGAPVVRAGVVEIYAVPARSLTGGG